MCRGRCVPPEVFADDDHICTVRRTTAEVVRDVTDIGCNPR